MQLGGKGEEKEKRKWWGELVLSPGSKKCPNPRYKKEKKKRLPGCQGGGEKGEKTSLSQQRQERP